MIGIESLFSTVSEVIISSFGGQIGRHLVKNYIDIYPTRFADTKYLRKNSI